MEYKSSFISLPAEIRLRIYGLLLPTCCNDRQFPSALDNLRRTSHAIKKELDHEIVKDMYNVPNVLKTKLLAFKNDERVAQHPEAAAYHLTNIHITTDVGSGKPFISSKHVQVFINIDSQLEFEKPALSPSFDNTFLQALLDRLPTHVQHISFHFRADPQADLDSQDTVIEKYMSWNRYLIDIITTGDGLRLPRTPLRIQTSCEDLTDSPPMMQVYEMLHEGVDKELRESKKDGLHSGVVRNRSNQATVLVITFLGGGIGSSGFKERCKDGS